MTQRIIYQTDDGGVAVIVPSNEAVALYGLDAIAQKDVPACKPYKIVDASTVNFATAMPDANFVSIGMTGPKGSNSETATNYARTSSSVRMQTHSGAAVLGDAANNSLIIIR
jgi:hypothetical protein